MRLNKKLRERKQIRNKRVESTVSRIINDVRKNGDAAVRKYCELYDAPFEMGEDVDDEFVQVLERAKSKIEEFHNKQVESGYEIKRENGAILGQIVRPLERVAVYVPGGTAAYPSSVLMNVIPAKIAKVPHIAIFTPCPNNIVRKAAQVCGVDSIYQIGGAQAIAAATYGTETIPRFDKVVGPGNIYVTTAKRIVYGDIDIDMIAGPSDILIIADDNANPKYIAADLLSQAEHDTLSSSILITTCEKIVLETEKEITLQLKQLLRSDIIRKSLRKRGAAIVVDDIDEAFKLSNEIAPEHLEILTQNPRDMLSKVKNAGSIFLGEYTPEPLGDYISGTNHVLPTEGTARFYSPLGVYDFVKRSSYSYYTATAFEQEADDVINFAMREGLDAHANSIRARFAD